MSKPDERAPAGCVLVSSLKVGDKFTAAFGGNYTATGWYKDEEGGCIKATGEGVDTMYAGCATVQPGHHPKGWLTKVFEDSAFQLPPNAH